MEVKTLETEGLKIHFFNDYKLVVLSKFVCHQLNYINSYTNKTYRLAKFTYQYTRITVITINFLGKLI